MADVAEPALDPEQREIDVSSAYNGKAPLSRGSAVGTIVMKDSGAYQPFLSFMVLSSWVRG